MKYDEKLDQMLRQALLPTVEPSYELNQKIINKLKENNTMKLVRPKKISIALIAAIITLTVSITGFAAWHFLNPEEVAEHLEDKALAKAFTDKNAIQINESVVSGIYNFTLLGIVSGEGLSDFKSSAQDICPDRTYAVVSIAKQDGSKMPDTQDEDYGEVGFFISPLIKGQKPWLVNIASMNGGYNEFVIDGVMYRLIECDGVEKFADRGLYLCISTSDFYDVKAFNYNEKTGEITPNADYEGANALFNLPLDVTKADHEKAEKYLKELFKETEEDSMDSEETFVDWEKEVENGEIIPESIKEVTYNEDGLAHYEYEGHKVEISVKHYFKEDEIGVFKTVSISSSKTVSISSRIAIQFCQSAEGVFIGRTVKLNDIKLDEINSFE
jgi:hypothetical protein